MVLLLPLLGGCGNSGGETTPAPAQTGDVKEFPNAVLLASPEEVDIISQSIVLDARTDGEYKTGHFPGAISAPPTIFENNRVLLTPPELAEKLGSLGVTRTSKIIIYDNIAKSRGAAGRLFWILESLGCTDVRIFNGGWYRLAKFYESTTVETTLPAVEFIPITDPELTDVKEVTKVFVAEHFLPTPLEDYLLIDVRTDVEYLGSELAPRTGHIPGAINFPYIKCFNSDKTVLNYTDLKILLEAHGITLNKELVAYSTIGHRSGFFYFLCRLMGYENMSNYVGSIEDWAKAKPESDYPMNTGSAP